MKKNLNLLLSIILLGCCCSADAQISYSYTGTTQTYTVPAATFSLSVDVVGGCGGSNGYGSNGGSAGRVVCLLTVTPGQVLNISVGSAGGNGSFYSGGAGGNTGTFTSTGGTGGYGYFNGGGGGGGATDIRVGGLTLADRIIAAGAGGGAGYDCGYGDDGGNGGGAGTSTGVAGNDCSSSSTSSCGQGATATTAGAAATSGGTSGAPLFGGDASSFYFAAGGGGGGGYFGGGGGYTGGGGGGSSYADASLTSAVSYGNFCTSDGNGYVTIYPCTLDAGTITSPAVICLLSTVTFTDPATGGSSTGGTWTSADPTIASVNSTTGAVTGVALGTTTITYTINPYCGTAFSTASITVINVPSPIVGADSVCAGGGPDTLRDATPGGVWSSSNTSVADIGTAGDLTTYMGGVTIITYGAGLCTATKAFTVNPNPTAITGPTTVCKFATITLSESLAGGTWTSTVPGAATVNSTSGVVTGVASGATDIVYTTRYGCVTPPFIVNITIPPLPITGQDTVCVGSAVTLNELVGGGTWGTSSSAAAPVSGGTVTGLLPGVVTISYTTLACTPAYYTVTVHPLPSIITGPTTICIGYVSLLTDSSPGGTWSSSNPDIIISPTGDVTSSFLGETSVITYTLPTSCAVSTVVDVNNGPGAISGPDSVCVGANASFTDPTAGGLWTTTDLSIAAIVDTSGVLTGVSGGNVTISYTLSSGCNATKQFTVNPLILGSVSIAGGLTGIICDGTPDTLTAVPVNGGAPTYLWEVFSDTARTHSDTASTFVDISLHGDVVMLFMMPHNICAMRDTVGDTLALNVYPYNTAPVVTIATSSDTIITYLGEAVTFFSNVTWGGAAPTYQWYVNGAPVPGATNTSYEALVYTDASVYCEVTGYAPCDTTLPLTPGKSNTITIHANYLGIHTAALGANELTLLPNPNNGSFVLRGTVNTTNDISYEVVDMLGRSLATGKTTPKNGLIEQQINIGDVAPGTYLLQVTTVIGIETFHFVVGK